MEKENEHPATQSTAKTLDDTKKLYILYLDHSDPACKRIAWLIILASPKIEIKRRHGDSCTVKADQNVIDALLLLYPCLRATQRKIYKKAENDL